MSTPPSGGPWPPGPPDRTGPGGQPHPAFPGQPLTGGSSPQGQAPSGPGAEPVGPLPPPGGSDFLHGHDQPRPGQYRPPLVRRTVKVGAPIGVLIALGVVVLAWLVVFVVVDPVAAGAGALLATVAIGVVVGLYLWLDRWEPEPPRLLIFAFLWGAAVATAVAMVVNTAAALVIGPGLAAVVSAPVVEELAKGSFLLLMMTGRRRKELTSLTDCLIYAGLTAAGFAWTEDILYLVQNPDNFGAVAVMRLVFSPFAHPLFTSVTAIGVYYSMRQRSGGAKAGLIIAGFVGAMVLHAIWNLAPTFLGLLGFVIVYLVFMVPVFAGGVVLAVFSRRRERQLVAKHLPGMADAHVITRGQAMALETLAGRSAARDQVRSLSSNADAAAQVNAFVDAVTELAFVRDRYDRGLADQRLAELHQSLVASIHQARASEPALDRIEPIAPPRASWGATTVGHPAPPPLGSPPPHQQRPQPPFPAGQGPAGREPGGPPRPPAGPPPGWPPA